MIQTLIAAATRLADTIEQENAALTALDLPRAAAMVAAKQLAAEEFTAAKTVVEQAGVPPLRGEPRRAMEQALRRLAPLAEANRALLQRAITVQDRVIGVIARAMPRAAMQQAPRYGSHGEMARTGRPPAIAISAHA